MGHPLDPLDSDEIRRAVTILRGSAHLPDDALCADVDLVEPAKPSLAAFASGTGPAPERRVRLRWVPGPALVTFEAVVSLTREAVESARFVEGVNPSVLHLETYLAGEAVRNHPEWQHAMRDRGLEDFDQILIDPWQAGRFGLPAEEGRRLARAVSYVREDPRDNICARPIEGVTALVDLGTREVLEVVDHGPVPIPKERGRYSADDVVARTEPLRPISITQPEGPSFTLDGPVLRWQRWEMRVSLAQHEGLVLHEVGYRDQGRLRPILHRASISDMVVPYGHPGPMHGWKNAFDASEWGLGKVANSLMQGCDCLGEIRYLDATMASEHGRPFVIKNAICIHEEDVGIGWKHSELFYGWSEVRRGRRLVVSSFVTAGNYDYGFYWYFYLDGTIEMEVKLTGIVTTIALHPGEEPTYATRLTPDLAAPNHQHLFCARLDFDVDGTANSVYEVDVEPEPAGPDNPWGNAFTTKVTLLESEQAAQRDIDTGRSRVWKIVNEHVRNRAGDPVAYKLVPGATPKLLAHPDSSIGRRAGFATHNLWVTPYEPAELRPAGDYPNQHAGGAGLPEWTAANRSLVDTDVVVWHCFGVTHVPRPEDWPVMPVERAGFALVPTGFFDGNPALDVPAPAHIH